MGLIPKHVLEELKREKREAKAAKKRKENIRPKIVRFLIVCEGSKPNRTISSLWCATAFLQ